MSVKLPPKGTVLTAAPSPGSSWVRSETDPDGQPDPYLDVSAGRLLSGLSGILYMDGETCIFKGAQNGEAVLENPGEGVTFAIPLAQFESDFGASLHAFWDTLVGDFDYQQNKVFPGATWQGFVYKNPNAFAGKSAEICYIPELDFRSLTPDENGWYSLDQAEDECIGYTYQDFVDICDGEASVARVVFDSVDWQSPGTYYDELDEEDIEEFRSPASGRAFAALSERGKDAKETGDSIDGGSVGAEQRNLDTDAR